MPPTATLTGPEKSESLDAVLNAIRLVTNSETTVASTKTPGRAAMLPTARARVAIDDLAGWKTYAALDASMPHLKATLADALNWAGQARATKPVTKALSATMSGTSAAGESLYPQSLEMLSYLALCAPLLEPDRLARIAVLANETPNAYKPIRYLVTPAAQLQKVLTRYSEARRETILASLWVETHAGRWWDITGGTTPDQPRRRHVEEGTEEQRAAITAQLDMALAGRRTPSATTVSEAFTNRLLTYSRAAENVMKTIPVKDAHDRARLVEHVKHPDADVPVLLSFVPGLHPDDRPESPIPAAIAALFTALGDDLDAALPARPDTIEELFPAASCEAFPMPAPVRNLSGTEVPGLPGSEATMMRHAAMLRRNATHMGNCTFSYKTRCEKGSAFIGHLQYEAGEYNFAVLSDGANFGLGEVNSRFNAGQVPVEVFNALTALVGTLGAA